MDSNRRNFCHFLPKWVKHFFDLFLLTVALVVPVRGGGNDPVTISFNPSPAQGINNASVTFRMPASPEISQVPPKGILVLAPGCNQSGAETFLAQSSPWPRCADRLQLVIAAVSFRSPEADLIADGGYYQASRGSGQILLSALAQWQGNDSKRANLPLYLFGFSGGAHFVSQFALWQPQRVAGFVAYSAAWWPTPTSSLARVPGLILCGYQDERFDATFDFFQRGRQMNATWCFARVRYTSHELAPNGVDLAQDWLTSMTLSGAPVAGALAHPSLASAQAKPNWTGNVYTNAIWSSDTLLASIVQKPTSLVWFPDEHFAHAWQEFNHKQELPPNQ